MKKKIIIIIAALLTLAALIYAEYRFIMEHQCPYLGENGTVYIEMFGRVDKYYAEEAPKEMCTVSIQYHDEYLASIGKGN